MSDEPGIFTRPTDGSYRYFAIRGDREAGVYRVAGGQFEVHRSREEGWVQIVPSDQDYDSFFPITRAEAKRIDPGV